MALGPVELLVVKFPGSTFTGAILPAIRELVESGTVSIVDLMLMSRDSEGNLTLYEFSDLDPDLAGQFEPLVTATTELLSEDDVYQLGELLENNSSAGVVLFENTWAARFADAVRQASGEVVLNERIPRVVIEEIERATAAME
ncbi:MAG: DUF6325 family protein [Thermomicrobiales bacterium]